MKLLLLLVFIAIVGAVSGGLYYVKNMQNQVVAPAPIVPALQHKVTLIEGITLQCMESYLSGTGSEENSGRECQRSDGLLLKPNEFTNVLKNIQAREYGIGLPNNVETLEGYLFPDTYLLTDPPTGQELAEKMLENFQEKFVQAAGQPQNTNGEYMIPGFDTSLSQHELITLASIVEKESGGENNAAALEEQRRTIAGVFYNRLKIGQALESDSTVNYATGENRASATFEDLEHNSPYNTYKYRGLPPGPIGNPSYSSIYSVLHPLKTDYFFFLHKQPSGEVVYGRNLNEHLQNKRMFLK